MLLVVLKARYQVVIKRQVNFSEVRQKLTGKKSNDSRLSSAISAQKTKNFVLLESNGNVIYRRLVWIATVVNFCDFSDLRSELWTEVLSFDIVKLEIV